MTGACVRVWNYGSIVRICYQYRHGHFLTLPDGAGGTHIKACPSLPTGTTLDSRGIHGETYRAIQFRERQLHAKILAETEMKEFRVVYSCQFEADMKNPESDVYAFFNRRQDLLGKKLPEPLKIRGCLRGGHCELYQMEAKADSQNDLRYYDINSL